MPRALRTLAGVVGFGLYMAGTDSLTFLFFIVFGRV